jgi:hypothetical protein
VEPLTHGRAWARAAFLGLACFWLALAACGSAGASGNRAVAFVDSVVPAETALARFRDGLREPAGLAGGTESREGLVRAFVRALERRDTVALAALIMDRAEFAYLYYPSAPEAQAPYDLSPALMWFLLREQSIKGIRRALQDRGGTSLHYLGHSCAPVPSKRGDNLLWGPCEVRRLREPQDTVSERLFGLILEHKGRFKFVSYANGL